MQDSARPDPMPHFIEVARAIREPGQPVTALAALDKALEGAIGHRLFTVLAVNLEKNENRRYYSNRPREYPVGGVKPIVQDSPITHKVMLDGICHINHDYAQLSRVFFDHELIRSLGCESSINVPVRWNGRTVGMLNLLHRSGWYRDEDIPTLSIFAALATPALQAIIAERGEQRACRRAGSIGVQTGFIHISDSDRE